MCLAACTTSLYLPSLTSLPIVPTLTPPPSRPNSAIKLTSATAPHQAYICHSSPSNVRQPQLPSSLQQPKLLTKILSATNFQQLTAATAPRPVHRFCVWEQTVLLTVKPFLYVKFPSGRQVTQCVTHSLHWCAYAL